MVRNWYQRPGPRRYDVLTFDFRGHGRSEGVSALHFGRGRRRTWSGSCTMRGKPALRPGRRDRLFDGRRRRHRRRSPGRSRRRRGKRELPHHPTPNAAWRRTPATHDTRLWRWWAWLMGTRIAGPHLAASGQWPDTLVDRPCIAHPPADRARWAGHARLAQRLRAVVRHRPATPKTTCTCPWALHAMPMASIGAVMDWLDRHMPDKQANGFARTA
jgi:hypothetical protein